MGASSEDRPGRAHRALTGDDIWYRHSIEKHGDAAIMGDDLPEGVTVSKPASHPEDARRG